MVTIFSRIRKLLPQKKGGHWGFSFPLAQVLSWSVFLFLLLYSYAFFFRLPYFGFELNSATREVTDIFSHRAETGNLLLGDRIVQIDAIRWEDFERNLTLTIPAGNTGDKVSLLVQRGEELVQVSWILPDLREARLFRERAFSQWWLPYVFWSAGVITILFVRPKDKRWKLLVAFNFLTAVWLSAGMLSRWHLWYSALVLRSTLWLCLPVYWHLHWEFPRPLSRLPSGLSLGFYGLCFLLAVLAWFQLLPATTFLFVFITAVTGSLIILLAHYAFFPNHRRQLGFVLGGVGVAVIFTVGLAVVNLLGIATPASAAALLTLPILPFSYLYTVYYHQLGGFTVRTNRLISLYLFIVLNGIAVLLLLAILGALMRVTSQTIWISIIIATVSSLSTTVVFPVFRRWVEKHLLRIPLPSSQLLESYATQITDKLNRRGLSHILQKNVLPTLLIRQSALIRLTPTHELDIIYREGVEADQLPSPDAFPALLERARVYQPPTHYNQVDELAWIRLILPLQFGKELIGVWLLGTRDPDDVYYKHELPTLEAIANQTAVALSNITQTENLHWLYQVNIDKQDEERMLLALALHDDVLNEIAVLGMHVDEENVSSQFQQTYTRLTTRLRQTIHDLRPSILEYGLWIAMDQLIENFSERSDYVPIHLDVPESQVRYPRQVEQHIFRIAHQAVTNALKHSYASIIHLKGTLSPEEVRLAIVDDGCGFKLGNRFDLKELLANNHFGLVGMYERADLINGRLEIITQPGNGTQVIISWKSQED